VRPSASTLGRLRRKLGLLCLVGIACSAAAHASAAPSPTLFRLTIVGTTHQEWSVTAAPVVTGECRRETSGIRTATFRTSARHRVLMPLPVLVRGSRKVTLAGANTTERRAVWPADQDRRLCADHTSVYQGDRHAASTRAGVVTFKGQLRLATADCPRERQTSWAGRSVAANLVRLPKNANGAKTGSIKLSATPSRQKVYSSPQQGASSEASDGR
jgi:hypothetical protein